MEWLKTLLFPIENPSVAQSMVTIMLAIGSGVFFGRLKLGKITFGVSAVMFTGLILGHFGYRINDNIFDFIRDFTPQQPGLFVQTLVCELLLIVLLFVVNCIGATVQHTQIRELFRQAV